MQPGQRDATCPFCDAPVLVGRADGAATCPMCDATGVLISSCPPEAGLFD